MSVKKVNSRRVPIYRDAGFYLKDIPTMKKAFTDELTHPSDPDLYIYSRYRNPTVVDAEQCMAKIEGAAWSLLCQSGMAAIDIALSIFQNQNKPNKWAFFTEIYGGTNSYIDRVLVNRRGIEAIRFAPDGDMYDLDKFSTFMEDNRPSLVFVEAMSNPMLIVANVKKVISIAKKYGASVIVDNTFATPYLLKPLDLDADIVIHSGTKYLAGHGNLSVGVISGNSKDLCEQAIEYRKLVGHMISPDEAYRFNDMLKSFDLRVKQHFRNAQLIAEFLSKHPKVEKVLYPSLENHPTHQIAEKLFDGKGYGGIVTFDLAGENFVEKQKRCEHFTNVISDEIPLIPTLGDADTILMPVEPVWGNKYPFPGMIRLSVGIEDVSLIISAIELTLDKC